MFLAHWMLLLLCYLRDLCTCLRRRWRQCFGQHVVRLEVLHDDGPVCLYRTPLWRMLAYFLLRLPCLRPLCKAVLPSTQQQQLYVAQYGDGIVRLSRGRPCRAHSDRFRDKAVLCAHLAGRDVTSLVNANLDLLSQPPGCRVIDLCRAVGVAPHPGVALCVIRQDLTEVEYMGQVVCLDSDCPTLSI